MHSYIKRYATISLALLIQIALVGQAHAQKKAPARTNASTKMQDHAPDQILDVNNMTIWMSNDGMFPWIDHFSGVNGTLPKGTAGPVFAQGFVWGGTVRDGRQPSVRVNGSTYATGLDPGNVERDASGNVIGPADRGDLARFHVWRVVRNWKDLQGDERDQFLRGSASQFFGVQRNDVSPNQMQVVAEQYEYDWNNWPADIGAPFEDVDGNGSYDPAVDIPGYPGASQTLWRVTNDLRGGASEQSYGSPAIGLEVQTTAWGYDFAPSSPLGNIAFIRSRVIYAGLPNTSSDARIDSMYAVWWADPDVGTHTDDFSGSDTTLSMGFTYNANTSDATYSSFDLAPPAVGWDFLQGPVSQAGDTLGMTSFVYFAAGSDIDDPDLGEYSGTLQWYNLMRGMRPRPEYPAGDPFVNPLTGEVTEFALTGDPISGAGWIDGMQLPPGDRRTVQSSGPFTLLLGDTVDVVVGQVGAVGTTNLSSVTVLKYHDQFAQFTYDQNFQLPSPPPTPPVRAAELDQQIVLNWGFNQTSAEQVESFSSEGFDFEGYNVYQLPTARSNIRDGVKVATFDKENLVSTIIDNVIDTETGFVIQRPVQISPNEGLQRFLEITQDRIRQRPLANGVEYHFALTTYSFLETDDPSVPFRMLESPPVILTVRPQPPKPGRTNITGHATELPVERTSGTGDAVVQATVVDPDSLVDATWTVTFNPDTTWSLLRNGATALSHRPFGSFTDTPLVDGIQVNVSSVTYASPATILDHFAVEDDGGDLHLWGDATLFGALTGFYSEFTGGSPPSAENAILDLEFRFTGDGAMEEPTSSGGQLATYWERAGFGLTDLTGVANEVIRMPFELWDIENDRQVNFAVIGRNADGESPWGDGVGEYYRMSARDYIIPIMTNYDEAAVQANGTSPIDPEATWLLFFVEGGESVWETGDVYRVLFTNPITPGVEEFAFATEAPVADNQEDLAESVDEINVFPNPYVGYNRLEANRFQKFMRFTHLPNEATIRIFNLSGTMVREIVHESQSQFEDWDLTNQDNIPVASGIYIAHVDTDHGEKVLKLAIVQEEQVLQRY